MGSLVAWRQVVEAVDTADLSEELRKIAADASTPSVVGNRNDSDGESKNCFVTVNLPLDFLLPLPPSFVAASDTEPDSGSG